MSPTVELVLDCGCDLGEGPIWDTRTQTLYFVDINRNCIHSYVPSTKSHNVIKLGEPVGAVALTSDPSILLAATRSSISTINLLDGGQLNVLASVPESHGTDAAYRFNDGKVVPQTGCFIVGRMHSDWRRGLHGRLYCLEPASNAHGNSLQPQLREILETVDIGLPNGMAWSADGQTCFFVDSAAETITAYNVDASGAPTVGSKALPRVISHTPSQHAHVPDGMTIDSNGNLWVVYGDSGAVTCIDPVNGNILTRVELPIKRPTSCCFGGSNLDELYVTTRIETGPKASPHHGGLFKICIPGVTGQKTGNQDILFTLP